MKTTIDYLFHYLNICRVIYGYAFNDDEISALQKIFEQNGYELEYDNGFTMNKIPEQTSNQPTN